MAKTTEPTGRIGDSGDQPVYRALLDAFPGAVMTTSTSGEILEASSSAFDVFGEPPSGSFQGLSLLEMSHGASREALAGLLSKAGSDTGAVVASDAASGAASAAGAGATSGAGSTATSDTGADTVGMQRRGSCECRFLGFNGQMIEAHVSAYPIRNDGDEHDGDEAVLLAIQDVTEQNATTRLIEYQALHDPLTGVPNRLLLMDRLGQALARLGRDDTMLTVLFCGMDRFKTLNDSIGHAAGDQLLVAIAHRLRSCLRPGDTIARFGGDEFVLLCEGVAGHDDALAIANRVMKSFDGSFRIGGEELRASASIGVAVEDHRLSEPEDLIRDANAAMEQAKRQGSGRISMCDESTREQLLRRLHVESSLRQAIERGELQVYYQPIVNVKDRSLQGLEALLRWHHPERGVILPDNFIPIAEDSGLILAVGRWVLEAACRQAQRWEAQLPAAGPIHLSVNLSARQLLDPDFVNRVQDLYASGLVKPRQVTLCLEVTETILVEDSDEINQALRTLCGLGVLIGIDDFGTGYSSLSYLKRFPITTIKIDKSFVAGIDRPTNDRTIISAVVDLAHSLGLVVTAEGVERSSQLDALAEIGCDLAQGYLFGRALSPAAIEELLDASDGDGEVILGTELSSRGHQPATDTPSRA